MKDIEKLETDEARRIAQHEAVKGELREKIHSEIRSSTEAPEPSKKARTEELADLLSKKAVTEVAATEADLDRARLVARISQVIDYLFYLVYGIVGLEVGLSLLGARQSAGFKQFIDAIAAPFLAPFRGLMPNPGVGPFRLMLSYVIALVVFVLLHRAINGLLRLVAFKKTTV
jgi:uncharacterized protein YggT (Ycf19 family)